MRKLICLILSLFAVMLLSLPILAQDDENANLLVNPGFEEHYVVQEGILPRLVAEGWTAWNLEPETTQPEYTLATAANSDRVLEGEEAQRYFSFFSPHIAGVYQVVSGLTPGETVTFSIYAYTFSSNDAEAIDTSDVPCAVTVEVGIDPTGGEDPESDAIVWSAPVESCDVYEQHSISAAPDADSATVFVRTNASIGRLTTEVYLDEASLTVGEGVAATDEPAATDEFVVTDEVVMTEEVAPTDELVVTDEVVVTEEASPTFEIVTAEVTLEVIFTEAPTLDTVVVTDVVVEPTLDMLTVEVTPDEIFTEVPTLSPVTEEPTVDAGVIASATVDAPSEPTLEPTLDLPTVEPTPANPTDFPTVTPVEEIAATATEALPTEIPATPTENIQATETTEAVLQQLVEEYPGRVEHVVSFGESVYIIANLYGSSVPAIIEANGLNENALIFVGQRLIVPVKVPPAATIAPTDVLPTPIPLTPTATITPVPADVTDGSVYIVQPGDTLFLIARRFNTTVATLAQMNGIVNINSILVGQRLTLPTDSIALTPTAAPVTPTPVSEIIRYVVQPGDSLFRLSLIYNVPIQKIAEANEIANIHRIFVGQVLNIPQPVK